MAGRTFYATFVTALLYCSTVSCAWASPRIPSCVGDVDFSKSSCFASQAYMTGDEYVGVYENGQFNGEGKLTMKDGTIYSGLFANGELNGNGYLLTSSGDLYKGKFLHNKLEGQAEVMFKNGNKFSGNTSGGKLEGEGQLTNPPIWTDSQLPELRRRGGADFRISQLRGRDASATGSI